MATPTQRDYIRDLAVKKTKEYKEFVELVKANDIFEPDSDALKAVTIAEMTDKMTDLQASKTIDALLAKEVPKRATNYADARIKRVIGLLDSIKAKINDWNFK